MCTRPYRIMYGKEYINVPCGHCLECVKQYQQDTLCRLEQELKQWKRCKDGTLPCVFFTLTYADSHVPKVYLYQDEDGPKTTTDRQAICHMRNFERIIEFNVDSNSMKNAFDTHKQAMKSFKDTLLLSGYNPYEDTTFQHSYEDFELTFANAHYDLPIDTRFEDLPSALLCNDVFAFNSVCKADVITWIKKCRIYVERKLNISVTSPSGKRCNARYNWYKDNNLLPDTCLSPTFKYYITSEYGPKTLRPHYHGVIFGITKKEFEDIFVPLWYDNFGDPNTKQSVCVQYDTLDETKGGMLYIAKYCSKGFFEHPLSTKDFIYPSGKEYHSNLYEWCLRYFGVNFPLVAKTFHLISNGVGLNYIYGNDIKKQFEVKDYSFHSKCGSRPSWHVHKFLPNVGCLARLVTSSRYLFIALRSGPNRDSIYNAIDNISPYFGYWNLYRHDLPDKYFGSSGVCIVRTKDDFITPVDICTFLTDKQDELPYNIPSYVNHYLCRNVVVENSLKKYTDTSSVKTRSCPLPKYFKNYLVSVYHKTRNLFRLSSQHSSRLQEQSVAIQSLGTDPNRAFALFSSDLFNRCKETREEIRKEFQNRLVLSAL